MKKLTVIHKYIFLALLILPSVLWGIKGAFHLDIWEYEMGENRYLAEMPEGFSAEYPAELEAYYNDHAPFRNLLIHQKSVVDSGLEGFYRKSVQPVLAKLSGKSGNGEGTGLAERYQEENTVAAVTETETEEVSCEVAGHDYEAIEVVDPTYLAYGHTLYECKRCGFRHMGDFTDKLIDDTYLPENISNNQVIIGRYDWLFYIGDNSRSYYKGTNVYTEEEAAEKLALLQSLQDACDAKGKQLLYIIWPNKEQVYPEYMPTYEVTKPKREEAFVEYVHQNSDINMIYPIEALTMGKLYMDTYYPYDTHWNHWGSYIGTLEMYKALGLPTPGLEDYPVNQTENLARGLVGTGMLDAAAFTNDADYVVDYRPEAGLSWSEGVHDLVNGYTEAYWSKASDPLFDKKIAFLGDSFRVSMLPYMEKDFAELAAVQRQNMDQIKTDIQNADIIVLTVVERHDGDLYERIPTLVSYLNETN